ncbi:MAG TPA: complex I NDUFA9 subunit family protein [Steroidobacteraceae bacterium]|jgi:NADH dehydrogenase|nr:complex I NDUFA9 subunit family protein [Steroidobacteraceae bacterium]
MNVCVLGGSGFVGTELVTRLVHAGHWVRVPTRNLAHAERLRVLDTAELRQANVHDPRVLSQLFADCEAVINLIGILNQRGRDTFETVHAALAGKVMAAARAAGVRRVLHMSSLGAAEHAPSRYLRSKAAAEAAVRALPHPEQAHPAVTIFRPSVIFGAGDSLTNRFAGLLRMSAGILPLARAGARFAPISVLDVAEAFMRALNRAASAGATYELCGPEVLTLEEIVRLTARVAGLPCHILRLPDALARVQAVVMGLLPGKPFSLDNFRSLTLDSVCREDGCAALGIVPRPMLAELPLYLNPAPLPA